MHLSFHLTACCFAWYTKELLSYSLVHDVRHSQQHVVRELLTCWAAGPPAGHDVPFVNNYGVWKDEFRELGLESTLDVSWDDATCFFGEGQQVRVGRGYGR